MKIYQDIVSVTEFEDENTDFVLPITFGLFLNFVFLAPGKIIRKIRMKTNRNILLYAIFLLLFISCKQSHIKNYIQFVDPLIGTGEATTRAAAQNPGDHVDHGQTIPAVTAPFGMTQWTMQTNATEKKCLAPYYFAQNIIQGFRATHWTSGSCVQDYGSFTVYPTSIENDFRYLPDQRGSLYIFDNATLSPAYLAANLIDNHITTEITATKRVGFFRFSWLESKDQTVIIDVNSDEGEGYIKIDVENREIVGYNPVHRIYSGTGKPAGFSGYFVARFDKKIVKYGTYAGPDYNHGTTEQKDKNDIGAYVSFEIGEGETLKMKMGTSFTSIENARKNIDAEIPDWDFEKCKKELEKTWNTFLSKIEVEGGSTEDTTKFYTAMYHSLIHPRLYSDTNGEYPGFDGDTTVHKAEGFNYYCDFSNWDIYRAQMPLLSIIAPEEYLDMVKSLVVKAEQGGWLPIFPMWNSYTSAMIGDHSSSVICDAAMKGFDFDLEKAYSFMRKNAFETPKKDRDYFDGKGRRALQSYLQYGYIPLEDQVPGAFHAREQVSRTLEYAYDDWAVAQVAQKLGKTEDFNILIKRAQNYRNVFDPAKGWMCGRFADGSFTDNFNATGNMPYITEGTPKHYTWYVPQDVDGLIELMGGKEKFHHELNQLIDNREYWHGNEPSHQIPYLFNYVDDWKKTQETVKKLLYNEYGTEPGGLSGNDDAGQMSAWFVFGAMGLYPVCPGSNEYQLSSPVFDKVTLHLDKEYYPGKKFELKIEPGNNYKAFSVVKINGKETEPKISHEDLQKGGSLEFFMQ